MCAGRGECSCGVCVCSSSTLDDGSAALYRGSGCECPPEDKICLNPEDGVSFSYDNYNIICIHFPIVIILCFNFTCRMLCCLSPVVKFKLADHDAIIDYA